MWRDVFSFYKECVARAFRGKFWRVEKWTGGLSVIAIVVSFAVTHSAQAERMIETTIPMYFFIGAFLLTAFIGFVTAPVEIYQEQREARRALEELRKPKLQVMLPGTATGAAEVSLVANTLETHGGNRFTNITQWTDTAIYLLVTNLGETEAMRCRGRVLWASRETDGETVESASIIEAVELPWSKTHTSNHLSIDIAPGDTARLWIANVRQLGNLWIFRDIADLPSHCHRVFGDEGHHKMLIQIDSANVATTQLLLSIRTEKATPPIGNGSWNPKASVSLLGQGGPQLIHPDVPLRIGEPQNG